MDDVHLEADRIFGPCNDPSCPGSRPRAVPSVGEVSEPECHPAGPAFTAPPRPVTITRRTARFGELAAQVEERLAQLGIVVGPKGIDHDLRERVRAVADHLGVSDRTALNYAPDHLPDEIAQRVAIRAWDLLEDLGYDRPVARPSLTLVK